MRSKEDEHEDQSVVFPNSRRLAEKQPTRGRIASALVDRWMTDVFRVEIGLVGSQVHSC